MIKYSLIIISFFIINYANSTPINEDNSLGGLRGKVGFGGEIINPSCSISTEDQYQEIDLGVIAIRDFSHFEANRERKLIIKLNNCEIVNAGEHNYDLSKVIVSFEGLSGSKKNHYGIAGDAHGIEIEIDDGQYETDNIEHEHYQSVLGNGEALEYIIRVVRNGKPMKKGYFSTSLRFKLNYQ
ncbi:fimbrial protein [Photobacterium damselae]|uniref:fimbrial protein n=1 Tax=Photobacterium damselae TaxID=38293 RepID=UPI000A78D0CB|nr:fimbrial protein [Photobacterium damselae]EJN6961735.1 type 1 fimbrial protein [Photobacterium damselae]